MAAAIERLLWDPQRGLSLAAGAQELEQYPWPRVRQGWIAAYHGTTACVDLRAS